MIRISTDPARKMVHAEMSGFLDLEEVAGFARDEQAAVRSMGLGTGEYLLLVETTECAIQSKEVVAAFQAMLVGLPLRAARIAVSREGRMTRMQTNRILSVRDNVGVFATVEEARAWLLADDAAAAA